MTIIYDMKTLPSGIRIMSDGDIVEMGNLVAGTESLKPVRSFTSAPTSLLV